MVLSGVSYPQKHTDRQQSDRNWTEEEKWL
jgi:hypothetical protein